MAAELKVSGRMTVKRLKENFKNAFEGTLRVYDGRAKADDNATLASIRRNEDAKGGELVCNGHLTVGSFERRMRDIFGIKVQVATPDDWTLALDGITLAKLKDIPEKCSKADMESLVAYKRRAKSVEPVEADSTEVNNNIELKDIAKDAVVFLSFTANEGEEFYSYLHNLIKDGAQYYVGENYGNLELPGDDVYDVADLDCWSENIEEEYSDIENLAEELVKDFVEARWDEVEHDNGAMAINANYTVTIFVGGNKVYEQAFCEPVWEDDYDDDSLDNNIELSDISKAAAIWVTFTTDEGDEVFYLDSLIKDGAKYSVDGIFEERFDVAIDDEQVAEMDCISDNILEDYDNVKDLTDQLFYEFYKFRRYEHSRGEASLANGDGYFVAIYIDGKKIYERNITTEFDHLFEDNSSDESLDGDIEKIKNRLSELGLTEFTFYTEDYCGELDDDLTDSLNSTIEADLHFQFNAGDEGERYVAPRKVKIIDDELFFDLEEVEINYECGPEVLSNYEGTTIEDILSEYWKSDVKKCLECMLEYMHNDDVVELNNESKEN